MTNFFYFFIEFRTNIFKRQGWVLYIELKSECIDFKSFIIFLIVDMSIKSKGSVCVICYRMEKISELHKNDVDYSFMTLPGSVKAVIDIVDKVMDKIFRNKNRKIYDVIGIGYGGVFAIAFCQLEKGKGRKANLLKCKQKNTHFFKNLNKVNWVFDHHSGGSTEHRGKLESPWRWCRKYCLTFQRYVEESLNSIHKSCNAWTAT